MSVATIYRLRGQRRQPRVTRRAVLAVAAAAVAGAINQQIPFAGFQVLVPCTGDTITFTQGSLHDMFYLTVNGSRFSMYTHDQPNNLMGMDTSGRSYEGVGVTEQHASGSFVNGQAAVTMVNNFNLIGKAGAPSYRTHETFHVTFTPSGTLTANHDSLKVTCG